MFLYSCSNEEVEFNQLNQSECKILFNKQLFNGIAIIRHENGEIQQRIEIKNGKTHGDFKTYDFSGGLLTQGRIEDTQYEEALLKIWFEGENTDGTQIFYTIIFCGKSMFMSEKHKQIIRNLKDSLDVNENNVGVILCDRQLKSKNYNYYEYGDLGR